ncbi:DUF4198 domain-containing protein [Candidatus Parvarchaeota archaeon]|nr:DUF4198 domain-containing protein [Candidatus Parvarchaeota archaeon]
MAPKSNSLFLLFMILAATIGYADYDPTVQPHTFAVYVIVNGSNATSGTIVSSYINGAQYVNSTLNATPNVTLSGATGSLDIGADNGTGTQFGGRTGDAVTFKVNNIDATANASATFQNGSTTFLTLVVGPRVINVTSPNSSISYTTGANLTIILTFSEAVNLTGLPRLELELGTTDRNATYLSGNNSATLNFTYTVQAGDTASDLTYVNANALTNTGLIYSSSSGVNSSLVLPSPSSAGSLAANSNIVIDTTAPNVSSVTSANTSSTYGTGANISITIVLSEAVNITGGLPVLELELGTTDRNATYVSGNGTTNLTFSFVVKSGDTSSDLNYTGTAALYLNGSTIRDIAGNSLNTTLPAGSNSLGGNKNIVIDTSTTTTTTTTNNPGTSGPGGSPSGSSSNTETSANSVEFEGVSVSFSRDISVSSSNVTTVSLTLKNNLTKTMKDFEVKERIPEKFATDPASITFNIKPDRFETGSIIAVWKFSLLNPGESLVLFYSVNRAVGVKNTDFTLSLKPGEGAAGQQQTVAMATIIATQTLYVGEKATATLTGADGKPIANAFITVTYPNRKTVDYLTDASGKITFTASAEGEYAYLAKGVELQNQAKTVAKAKEVSKPKQKTAPKEETTITNEVPQPAPQENKLGLMLAIGGLIVVVVAGLFVFNIFGKRKKGL